VRRRQVQTVLHVAAQADRGPIFGTRRCVGWCSRRTTPTTSSPASIFGAARLSSAKRLFSSLAHPHWCVQARDDRNSGGARALFMARSAAVGCNVVTPDAQPLCITSHETASCRC